MKVIRGKKHNYLSIILDYYSKEKLKVDMVCYKDNIVEEFSEELNSKGKGPWNESLLKINTKSPTLNTEKAKLFHSFIMKEIFLAKRARPDSKPGFMFLLMQVKDSVEED